MVDTGNPQLTIKAQACGPAARQLLITALIAALVIGFIVALGSFVLALVLLAGGLFEDKSEGAALLYAYLLVFAPGFLLLYGGFMTKFFLNIRRSLRGVENRDAEGEYRFYRDRLAATLQAGERTLNYADIDHVENRGASFGFYTSDSNPSGEPHIVFGLTYDQHKGDLGERYWQHIQTLVSRANPNCRFYNVTRGSVKRAGKSEEQQGRRPAKERTQKPMPIREEDPEKIAELVEEQPPDLNADIELQADGTLVVRPAEDDKKILRKKGREAGEKVLFGMGATMEELKWLKNLITRTLSGG